MKIDEKISRHIEKDEIILKKRKLRESSQTIPKSSKVCEIGNIIIKQSKCAT